VVSYQGGDGRAKLRQALEQLRDVLLTSSANPALG